MGVSKKQYQDANPEAALCKPSSSWAEHLPVYSSLQLFCGASEIGIEHQGARYRLKITRQGKLILNK